MNSSHDISGLIWALPFLFLLFKFLYFKKNKKRAALLIQSGAQIIDVRTPSEFRAAHNPHSINVPLDEIEKAAPQLDPKKIYVLCCASGTRSAMAKNKLNKFGLQAFNAGPWTNTVIDNKSLKSSM